MYKIKDRSITTESKTYGHVINRVCRLFVCSKKVCKPLSNARLDKILS